MGHNRKTMWIVVAVLIVASLALVAFMIQPSAEELLTQALETMQEVTQGYARVEIEADTPDEQIRGTFKVWGQLNVGPNGEPAFRLELLEASKPELPGVVLVGDGTRVWLWYPQHNTVYTGTYEELAQFIREKMAEHEFDYTPEGDYQPTAAPETAEEAVAKLLQYFTAEREGSEEIGDHSAYKVRLVPIPEKMPDEVRAAGGFIHIWIDAVSKAPLALEYAEGAVGYARITATELTLNAGIYEDTFTYAIPAGADVVQLVDLAQAATAAKSATAEFETLSPDQLPEGAVLLDTSQIGGASVQRYALPGGNSFTVAQSPADLNYQPTDAGTAVTVRGTDGTIYTDDEGARTLLSWTEGDVRFLIGGDLTSSQALSIAESLR